PSAGIERNEIRREGSDDTGQCLDAAHDVVNALRLLLIGGIRVTGHQKRRAVSSGAVSKPGLALCRFRKLRTKSEAPTSRISASATSITTSALSNRARRPLCPDPRAPS